MEIKININEEELQEVVTTMIARQLVAGFERNQLEYALREAVKSTIYSRKDELIERCVSRASSELVKKGMPELLKRLTAE